MTIERVMVQSVEGCSANSVRAFVGLGANLGEREATIRRALELLDEDSETRVSAVSRLRETEPVGFEAQPPFLNGACEVRTSLSARGLLDRLRGIERRLGRTRGGVRWGPRIIDLDLLLFGREEVEEPGLHIPHPRLHERTFVLEPLLDLDSTITLPDGRSVKDLLAAIK